MGLQGQLGMWGIGAVLAFVAACSPAAPPSASPETPAPARASAPGAGVADSPPAEATLPKGQVLASADPQIDPRRLDCNSPFGPGTSQADLEAAFGRPAVAGEDVAGPEGATFPAVVVNGTDPARRLEVIYREPADGYPGGGTARVVAGGSSWKLASGIGIGSTLREVVAANGGPFRMSGLGWDYGGFVNSWQGGALDGVACRIQVRFTLPDDASGLPTSIMGDVTLSSDDPGLAAPGIVVSEIGVAWSDP